MESISKPAAKKDHSPKLEGRSVYVSDYSAALSGNLCRCTGYNAIVRAVQRAEKEGKGLW